MEKHIKIVSPQFSVFPGTGNGHVYSIIAGWFQIINLHVVLPEIIKWDPIGGESNCVLYGIYCMDFKEELNSGMDMEVSQNKETWNTIFPNHSNAADHF